MKSTVFKIPALGCIRLETGARRRAGPSRTCTALWLLSPRGLRPLNRAAAHAWPGWFPTHTVAPGPGWAARHPRPPLAGGKHPAARSVLHRGRARVVFDSAGSRPHGFKGHGAGPFTRPCCTPTACSPLQSPATELLASFFLRKPQGGEKKNISNPRTGNLPLLSHETSCSYHHFNPERGFAM